jgi:hypothetical protein
MFVLQVNTKRENTGQSKRKKKSTEKVQGQKKRRNSENTNPGGDEIFRTRPERP